MSKTGKMTNSEKYIVAGMLGDKKSVKQIARELDRSEESVQKYIDGEHDRVCGNVAKGRMDAAKNEPPEEEDNFDSVAQPEIIKGAYVALKDAGLTDGDISKLMGIVLSTAQKTNYVFSSVDKLKVACIRRMKAGDYMIKKSGGGRDGIAIMTPAASTRLDESRKRAKGKLSRGVRGNIFNPKTGEIM